MLLYTGERCDRIKDGVATLDVCSVPYGAELFSASGSTFSVGINGLSRLSVRNVPRFEVVHRNRSKLKYFGTLRDDAYLIDGEANSVVCGSIKDSVFKWEIPCKASSHLFLGETNIYLLEPLGKSHDVFGGEIGTGPYDLSSLNAQSGAKRLLAGDLRLSSFRSVVEALGEIFVAGDDRVLRISTAGTLLPAINIDEGIPWNLMYSPTNVYVSTTFMKVDPLTGRSTSEKLFRISESNLGAVSGLQLKGVRSVLPVKNGRALIVSKNKTEFVDLELGKVTYDWPGECKHISADGAVAYTVEVGRDVYKVWNCSLTDGRESLLYSFNSLFR